MHAFRASPVGLVAALALVQAVHAQPDAFNVEPASPFAWSENAGWLNWYAAGQPQGAQGAVVRSGFLSGFVWGENIGWVNLGDGTPANGVEYANATGQDFGVNRDPCTGELSGLAWGENIGWVNFSGGSLALPPRPAVADFPAGRLRGYAWGENIGWVNLDDDSHFVSFLVCAPDFNHDGIVNSQDFFDFLAAFFSGSACADFSSDGVVNSQDFFNFLTEFFAGC